MTTFDKTENPTPNIETIKAIEDARNGMGLSRGFSSVVELMEDLEMDTWEELQKELFTPEEIHSSRLRTSLIGEGNGGCISIGESGAGTST